MRRPFACHGGEPCADFNQGVTIIPIARKRLLFELFFVSGFCGLLYQVVWVRLAFASFGIIAPVISVVI